MNIYFSVLIEIYEYLHKYCEMILCIWNWNLNQICNCKPVIFNWLHEAVRLVVHSRTFLVSTSPRGLAISAVRSLAAGVKGPGLKLPCWSPVHMFVGTVGSLASSRFLGSSTWVQLPLKPFNVIE